MSERVSYAEAAEILGVHFSAIAKMRRRGELTTIRKRDAALDRAEVEALAEKRRLAGKAWRKHERKPPVALRPDADHDWLRVGEVARMLGLTDQAITQRLREGRLAGTRKGHRWWVRLDHLEQAEAARLAGKTRRPQRFQSR